MELRKNPEIDLERKRGMFFSIGLLISISMVLTAFQWNFEIRKTQIPDLQEDFDVIFDTELLATSHPVPQKPDPVIITQPPVFVQKPKEELSEVKIDILPIEDPPLYDVSEVELPVEKAPEFYEFVEIMPTPEGGMSNFYKFLSKNLRYPKNEKRLGIGGKVFVQFIVDKDGSISNATIIKGVSQGCDQEALRVMALLPKWKPGKQGNLPVKVRMVVPINFVLN